jgi:hypothetical protein
MAFEHELSWSVSRAGTFAACKRRYYFDYYGSWNGWLRDAPQERQAAWRLKKMTRLPMLAGDVLHQAIAEYFDQKSEGRELFEEELVGLAVKQLRAGYKQSRDGVGLWRERPGASVHLAEHHYREPCVDESGEAAKEYGTLFVERIQAGGHFFMTALELAGLHELAPEAVLCIEGRAPGQRLNKDLPTFDLFDTKIYAIPDFACRLDAGDGGPRIWIYDWKSGRPREQDEFQLGVYTLYATRTWGAQPERVTCVDVYLSAGELRTKTFDETDLEPLVARIESSLAEMRALHFDAGATAGDPGDFPEVDQGSRECSQCNYRELCER